MNPWTRNFRVHINLHTFIRVYAVDSWRNLARKLPLIYYFINVHWIIYTQSNFGIDRKLREYVSRVLFLALLSGRSYFVPRSVFTGVGKNEWGKREEWAERSLLLKIWNSSTEKTKKTRLEFMFGFCALRVYTPALDKLFENSMRFQCAFNYTFLYIVQEKVKLKTKFHHNEIYFQYLKGFNILYYYI